MLKITFPAVLSITLAVSCPFTVSAWAQAPAQAADPAESAKPSTSDAKGTLINLGALYSVQGGHVNRTAEYSQITYKGHMINQQGMPLQDGDTTGQFHKADESQSDTPGLSLNFAQGSGSASDPRLNALGVNKFSVPQLNLSPFSSVSGLDASLDPSNHVRARAALGVESPSQHLFPSIANWVRLGADFEQEFQPSSVGGNQSTGTLTYRSFAGHALWTRSVRPMPFSLQELQALAPDKEMLVSSGGHPHTPNSDLANYIRVLAAKFSPNIFAGVKVQPSPDQNKDGTPNPNFNFAAWRDDQYARYQRAYSLEPSAAFWFESTGWYTYAGDPLGPHFQGLAALVLTLFSNAGTDSAKQIQLRYENGFDRSAPGTRRNQIFLSAGLAFN